MQFVNNNSPGGQVRDHWLHLWPTSKWPFVIFWGNSSCWSAEINICSAHCQLPFCRENPGTSFIICAQNNASSFSIEALPFKTFPNLQRERLEWALSGSWRNAWMMVFSWRTWSDEAHFYLHGQLASKNCIIWEKGNPHSFSPPRLSILRKSRCDVL